jgi:hypothetical protein
MKESHIIMNFKLIKTILAILLSSACFAANALEKTKVTILDPATHELTHCYAVQLQDGELYFSYEISKVVEKLLACPQAAQLVNKALKGGTILVRYGSAYETPMEANWSPKERLIRVSAAQPIARQLGHLLFEFANAVQSPAQLKLAEEVDAGKVAREQYVRRWERIEYDTAREFVPAVESCIAKNGWSQDSSLNLHLLFEGGAQAPAATFDKFWNLIKTQPHAEQYRKDWDRLYKNNYCKTNPAVAGCEEKGFWANLKKLIS